MDAKVKITLNHFVGGDQIAGTSGRFGDVYNPALGKVVKQVPLASAEEVQSAVENAANAFPGWAETPPARRAQVLYAYRALLHRHLDEVAEMVSLADIVKKKVSIFYSTTGRWPDVDLGDTAEEVGK